MDIDGILTIINKFSRSLIKNWSIILVILAICFSCKEKKVDKSIHEMDLISELIHQVLVDETNQNLYGSCKCIKIYSRQSLPPLPNMGNLEEFVERELQVEDSIHLNSQLDAYHKFEFNEDLLPGWKIISEEDFRLYQISSSNNSIWESLLQDCQCGFYSISRPIFDENFKRAIINFSHMCGPLCGGGATMVYILQDGKWQKEKEISSWVS
jgi:hypothetical protein